MKSQSFRLAVVERLRANRLADAGRELARAQNEYLQQRAHRTVLEIRLLECSPVAVPANGICEAATEFLATGQRRDQLRAQIETADIKLDELSHNVERAREEWLTARTEMRAVETLHDRHRVTVRKGRERTEQKEIDDLAASHGERRQQMTSTGSENHRKGGGEAA